LSNGAILRLGAAVEATDGRLGSLDQAVAQPGSGELSYLVVRRGWTNELFAVPAELVREVAPSGTVYLTATKAQARAHSGNIPKEALAATPNGREVRVPLHEEELIPEKRWVDLGELRIHKVVDTREELIREAVTRDDLLVERVPINQPLDAPIDTRVEDDWLVIPIMEEVIVVQKRLMLKEEIRIRKRQVTETQELHETVRSERAELEDATVHGVQGLDRIPAAPAPGSAEEIPAVTTVAESLPPAAEGPDAPEALAASALPAEASSTSSVPPAVFPAPPAAPDEETQTLRGTQPTLRRQPPVPTPAQRSAAPDDETRPIAVDPVAPKGAVPP